MGDNKTACKFNEETLIQVTKENNRITKTLI